MHRAHVKNAAAALLVHLPKNRTRGEECAIEVYRQRRFQFAKESSSSGATTWMPALLTRISTRPYAAMASLTPASTCDSLPTSIPIPSARCPDSCISAAAALRSTVSRSAMTILGAFARKGSGDFFANTTRGARDDGNLIFKTHVAAPYELRTV